MSFPAEYHPEQTAGNVVMLLTNGQIVVELSMPTKYTLDGATLADLAEAVKVLRAQGFR